ncbi:MAG TPA: hypothetical protein PK339_12475 [Flavitalea sp.]|nr:hypothetical protein [Flavitalea sp.]
MTLGNYPTIVFADYAEATAPGALGNKRKYVVVQENENAGGILTLHFFDGENLHAVGGDGAGFDPLAFALLSRSLNVFAGQVIIPRPAFPVPDNYTAVATDAGKIFFLDASEHAVILTISPELFKDITLMIRCADNTNGVSIASSSGIIELKSGVDVEDFEPSLRQTISLYSDGTNFFEL